MTKFRHHQQSSNCEFGMWKTLGDWDFKDGMQDVVFLKSPS